MVVDDKIVDEKCDESDKHRQEDSDNASNIEESMLSLTEGNCSQLATLDKVVIGECGCHWRSPVDLDIKFSHPLPDCEETVADTKTIFMMFVLI